MAEFLRAAWGAKPPKVQEPPLHLVPYGVVHHIGGGDAYPKDVIATLQAIQAMEQHGAYVDIAYNWGADQNGNIWELRGDVEDGATLGYAGDSFSVLAICNASAPGFAATQGLISGIAAAFRGAISRGVLNPGPYIDGHHWFDAKETPSPTSCPGLLMSNMPTIRSLVAGSPPTPAPPKVTPMYQPALTIAAVLQQTPTSPALAGVAPDGSVYAWGIAYKGGANGKPYFAGKEAAQLAEPNAAEKNAGKVYTIIDTAGERFSYPE